MNLNQVTIAVSDLARSIRFYETLGLRRIVQDVHYARFACPEGGSTFSLEVVDVAPTLFPAVLYFECLRLDDTVRALKARGLRFESEPRDEPWLWREARLRDPDGHALCLYFAGENRLNPPWRIKDA
jgi:catechol 2,3-dioxygenase-like lactoylglutathione lyase family enzyme